MIILSLFNGWASEVKKEFRNGGCLVAEGEDHITIVIGATRLILDKADFAANKLTVLHQKGWQKVN